MLYTITFKDNTDIYVRWSFLSFDSKICSWSNVWCMKMPKGVKAADIKLARCDSHLAKALADWLFL